MSVRSSKSWGKSGFPFLSLFTLNTFIPSIVTVGQKVKEYLYSRKKGLLGEREERHKKSIFSSLTCRRPLTIWKESRHK